MMKVKKAVLVVEIKTKTYLEEVWEAEKQMENFLIKNGFEKVKGGTEYAGWEWKAERISTFCWIKEGDIRNLEEERQKIYDFYKRIWFYPYRNKSYEFRELFSISTEIIEK